MDPNAEGALYCPEQIKIPGALPDILKEFTKAAIRTQPADLLQWSAAYFEALRDGQVPPVKKSMDLFSASSEARFGGISKGTLSVLHRQLGPHETVPVSALQKKWENAGCVPAKLDELLILCNCTGETVEWKKVLVLSCTIIKKTLPDAMALVCEIISPDPPGGASRIDVNLFHKLYEFLVDIDGEVPKSQVDKAMQFLMEESARYQGTVGPREFTHSLCPRLDAKDKESY